MRYVKLNNTDLEVSPICLGTVNYGTSLSKKDSKEQLSQFYEAGGNFIDTAHIYGDWDCDIKAISERTIGEWFQETGLRDKIVLATKGAHPDWGYMDKPRVNRACIEKDLKESLENLCTDYIDIYFLHRDDINTPVSEIMECLDDARKSGKIRYYGCSNWTLNRIKEAREYCKMNNLQGFTFNQLMWSLADINFYNLTDKTFILMDEETRKYHAKTGMNVMAYMSIAKGYFARRGAGENLPSSLTDVYDNPSNDQIYEFMSDVVKQGEYSYMDLSYMYIMAEKLFPSIPLASFDEESHLRVGMDCINKSIPEEIVDKLGLLKKYVYRE